MIEVSVIIPCFNEERSIRQTVEDVKWWAQQESFSVEVIVGDNNSVDNSYAIAEAAGAIVVSVNGKGYGNVIIEASKHAKSEYLLFLDADGQHNVNDLTSIYRKLKDGSDLVIGNRFHSGKRTFSTSFIKEYLGNPVLTKFGKFLFKSKIDYFHSGLRGVRTRLFNSLPLTAPGFELCSELIAQAEAVNAKIEQVPITVTKPFMDRRSNIRPLIDGFKHVDCLLNTAMLYRKYWRVTLFLLALNALLIAPFLLIKGMIVSSDTVTYDIWSDLFLRGGFNGIIKNNTYFFSKIFYLFHLLYICLLKLIFGSFWMNVHYAGNIVVQIMTGILIFFNSYRLTRNAGAALLSNILFYFSIEYVTITACVLSDTNFIFLINLLFFVFLWLSGRQRSILTFLLLLFITLYRPTGVIVLGVVLLVIIARTLHLRMSARTVFLFMTFIFVGLLAGNSYILSRGGDYFATMPLHFLESKFGFDLKGIEVWDRYFFSGNFYHNPINATLFYIIKLFRFFQFVVSGFDGLHQFFNIIFFGTGYLSFGYVFIKRNRENLNACLLLGFIFLTAFFHTFSVIDFDWRYRLVLVPVFCNLFAMAIAYNKTDK